MPSYCVAVGCKNIQNAASKENGITFHRLPKEKQVRQQWVKALRRKNWQPTDDGVYLVCSTHFHKNDFDQTQGLSRRKLKASAVPSVFPCFPSYYQPPSKKSRRELVRHEVGSGSNSTQDLPLVLPPAPGTVQEDLERESEETEVLVDQNNSNLHLTDSFKSDHPYTYPNNLEAMRDICEKLKLRIEVMEKRENRLYMQAYREIQKNQDLKNTIEELKASEMLSNEGVAALDKYEGEKERVSFYQTRSGLNLCCRSRNINVSK